MGLGCGSRLRPQGRDLTEATQPSGEGARALLRERDYMLFLFARVCDTLGTVTQSVTMGWQVYDLARATHNIAESALYVGFLGLATFLPLFALALPAGVVTDRYSRKSVFIACLVAEAACAAALLGAAVADLLSVNVLIGIAFAFGIARAFRAPAGVALAPMLVARPLLPRAIAWNSLTFQIGSITAPALAGMIVARWSSAPAYGASLGLYTAAVAALLFIIKPTRPQTLAGSRWTQAKEGLAYIRHNQVVLGAISLDLVAVLLGGATALLPIFARDVLNVGAEGFGWLRAGPAIGAAVVAVWLASHPIRHRAGFSLFAGVIVFGVATVIFGLSQSFWLSLLALATLGGADMVSVYVRQTLMQIVTPDAMRGRVAAVSFLFIGASNELGEFESGVTARLFGPVLAAILGGVGCLVATGLWAKMFPALRTFDRLE